MTTGQIVVRYADELIRMASTTPDDVAFRQKTMALLRRIVPFDAWCWCSVDPISGLPTDGVAQGSPLADAQLQLFALDYAPGGMHDPAVSASAGPIGSLRSQVAPTAAVARREAELLSPRGVGDELIGRIGLRGETWGFLSLYRDCQAPPFTRREVEAVRPFLTVWARRHRAELSRRLASPHGPAGTEPDSAVLVLEQGCRMVTASPSAEQLLVALPHGAGGLPPCVTALAGWLSAHRDREVSPKLPVWGRDGRWWQLRAHRLRGAVAPDTVAITVAGAPPAELVPLALAAGGLTVREREIAQMVLTGSPNAHIAAVLHITAYTVQDHLRHVFRKLGVSERRELAALLVQPRSATVRLIPDHSADA